jgi:glycosyltransferase involved in cell wall biosynthesis
LKILLLNYYDGDGGAAIAASRLFNALRVHGIDAYLGVVDKKYAGDFILSLKLTKTRNSHIMIRFFRKFLTKAVSFLKKKNGIEFKTSNQTKHSENKKTLIDIDYLNNSDYDLIHLHWINDDMISIEDIKKIRKPIILTMHDSWVFCGAEHHPNILENDHRYITGYTHTNKPKTTTGIDICLKTWRRKVKSWRDCRFSFISPSNFEKEALQKSALFYHAECTVIPNVTPTTIFRPLDKKVLRNIYQIPMHKKVLGFGTVNGFTDKKSTKGGYLLLDALQKIDKLEEYYLIIMGNADKESIDKIKTQVFITGLISNPYILASFYNVCDVFVCPSLLENLPNVCLESLFCGVPVAAFRTGGIPDIVEHKKTGYLAEPFDTEDLYQGILYCLDNRAELSGNSLRKAEVDFNVETIVRKHIELYEKVLKDKENHHHGHQPSDPLF